AKAEALAQLRADYRRLREADQVANFDSLMAGTLNNVSLLPFALYDQWVPAFARLFAEVGEDWSAYHEAVRQLGGVSAERRGSRLAALQGDGELDRPPTGTEDP